MREMLYFTRLEVERVRDRERERESIENGVASFIAAAALFLFFFN